MTPARRLGVVLVTGLALVAGSGSVPASSGAMAPDARSATVQPAQKADPDPGPVVTRPGATDAARARAIRDYWTPERMRAAVPIEELMGLAPVTSSAPARTAATTAERRRRAPVPRTAGKLFFTTSVGGAVCSAAAIKTRKRNQVITAGHCVHTGPHDGGIGVQWFDNFVFVPRYHNGRAPNGKWAFSNAWAFKGWTRGGKFTRDQAIIAFKKRNGRKLVGVVGGNRVAVGLGPKQRGVRIWGWPAEGPRYSGEVAVRCDGKTTRRGRSKDAKMVCPMTGGASGGPWLLKKGRKKHTGIIWAVTSRRTIGSRPKYLLSVPLPREVRGMINYIN
jgi:V8-like Glu-specific endopeptidase